MVDENAEQRCPAKEIETQVALSAVIKAANSRRSSNANGGRQLQG
jgi:hypothetical protein